MFTGTEINQVCSTVKGNPLAVVAPEVATDYIAEDLKWHAKIFGFEIMGIII